MSDIAEKASKCDGLCDGRQINVDDARDRLDMNRVREIRHKPWGFPEKKTRRVLNHLTFTTCHLNLFTSAMRPPNNFPVTSSVVSSSCGTWASLPLESFSTFSPKRRADVGMPSSSFRNQSDSRLKEKENESGVTLSVYLIWRWKRRCGDGRRTLSILRNEHEILYVQNLSCWGLNLVYPLLLLPRHRLLRPPFEAVVPVPIRRPLSAIFDAETRTAWGKENKNIDSRITMPYKHFPLRRIHKLRCHKFGVSGCHLML